MVGLVARLAQPRSARIATPTRIATDQPNPVQTKNEHQTDSNHMSMKAVIEPYLFFIRCEEAVKFYRQALGAELQMMMRYKKVLNRRRGCCRRIGEKIMHSSMKIGQTVVMASDGCGEGGNIEGFSLSISVSTEAEAQKAFAGLSEGGKVTMPLGKTFWSPCFGMLEDKFGIGWMVSVNPVK